MVVEARWELVVLTQELCEEVVIMWRLVLGDAPTFQWASMPAL